MSMNTPIGNITQTTPIKNFKELDEMQNEQCLLGIDNNAVGNGSKISFKNLVNSSISTDNDNLITKGTDDRLLVNTPVEIGDLSNLSTTDKSSLVAAINEVDGDITTEATTRANADNNLQSQIDAITAASDVTDIVGTYAELQAYDTTGLANNSIIKVLQDESRQDETAYYRWVITGGVGAWVLIGEEGPYYTKSQSDSKFATQETVGNLNNLATSDKSSVVNAMNELASVFDPTQTADYIKNSKAIYSGEVSENALILPQIKEMSHSTFDRSKFTVVGSPTITDDGVASGFSSGNYISMTIPDLSTSNNWELVTPTFQTGDIVGNDLRCIMKNANDNTFRITASLNTEQIAIQYKIGETYTTCYTGKFATAEGSQIKIVNNNGSFNFYYRNKENPNWELTSSQPTATGSMEISTNMTLGWHSNNLYCWEGSIDLKQFSITVDGVEVFSGNKTGVDTIKADNYTTSATPPTISEDGVMQPSGANAYYVVIPNLGVPTGSFRIEAIIENTQQGALYGINVAQQVIPVNLNFNGSGGAQWVFSTLNLPATTFSCAITNQRHKVIIGFDGISTYYASLYNLETNMMISEKTWTNSTKIENALGNFRLYTVDNNHKILDLNTLKIYVDGNLVYQPCLKIPYTEAGNGKGYNASTGSKIVQSVYRNRVSDMYEQFGVAPYYTLSDTDFTLPQGEIYGMIERKVDIDLSNMNASQSAINTVVNWGMPDYANGISVQSANSSANAYTAPCDGFINCEYLSIDTADNLPRIDGNTIGSYNATGIADNVSFFISKGQTFYCTGMYTQKGTMSNVFYPLKGAK